MGSTRRGRRRRRILLFRYRFWVFTDDDKLTDLDSGLADLIGSPANLVTNPEHTLARS
jgi:hypothetical protein